MGTGSHTLERLAGEVRPFYFQSGPLVSMVEIVGSVAHDLRTSCVQLQLACVRFQSFSENNLP